MWLDPSVMGRVCVAVVCLASLTLAGCGGDRKYAKLKCYPCMVKVTLDGRPYGPASVVLYTDKGQHTPGCVVTASGSGEFSTYKDGDGVPVGNYIVTAFDTGTGENQIPELYSMQDKSPIKFEMTATTTELKVELDSKLGPPKAKVLTTTGGMKSMQDMLKSATPPSNK